MKSILFLTYIYNSIIRTTHSPSKWKESIIVMILFLSRIIEKLILPRIYPILENCLQYHQLGFRVGLLGSVTVLLKQSLEEAVCQWSAVVASSPNAYHLDQQTGRFEIETPLHRLNKISEVLNVAYLYRRVSIELILLCWRLTGRVRYIHELLDANVFLILLDSLAKYILWLLKFWRPDVTGMFRENKIESQLYHVAESLDYFKY